MPAGRPKHAEPGTLYAFAHQFYWDFRRLSEGHVRWVHDQEVFERAVKELDPADLALTRRQKVALVRSVREDVAAGRLPGADKVARLKELGIMNLQMTRQSLYREVEESTRKQVKVPGKPEVIEALLRAQTSEAVRTICADAFVLRSVEVAPGVTREVNWPNWPISTGSVLPAYLAEHALQFIAAKSDFRFPKSTSRPSSQLKQLWFLSRALAGALYGVSVRTSINLVGSKRPDEIFEESRAAKSSRRVARRQNRKKI
jgi:hypothetical protein